ncbi:MAG: phosphoribosylanthranilate isomerase [Thermodesulfovibrio sp.]
MLPYQVKICGIRSAQDLKVVSEAKPDAVGFIVGARHYTPDEVSPNFVRFAIELLPEEIIPVMVTHVTTAKEALDLLDQTGCKVVQLHGNIPPEEVYFLMKKAPELTVIKAFHANIAESLVLISLYTGLVDAIILDTASDGRVGGTGKTHDWKVSARISQGLTVPLILAGGLNPDNVSLAIEQVAPHAVDVNTGVEDEEGNKDIRKTRDFIKKARLSFEKIQNLKFQTMRCKI